MNENFVALAIYGWFMEHSFSYSTSDYVRFTRLNFCGWDVLTDEDYLKANEHN